MLQGNRAVDRKSWDAWMLGLAAYVSTRSRDPSTKVGAVLMRPDKTIASVGYNGLPRGIADDERLHDREWKYANVVHAEINALVHAREPVGGYTLFVYPFHPCSNCAAAIIQAGVTRIVTLEPAPEQKDRWGASFLYATNALREAGVSVVVYPTDEIALDGKTQQA